MSTARLADIDAQTAGNTVVYSGYQPFVGSGAVQRRWDLTQRLVHAPIGGLAAVHQPERVREFVRPPFSAAEISHYVGDYIRALADDPVPERGLPSLTVADKVFVAGTEIDDLELDCTPAELEDVIRRPVAPRRHYLTCQVVSWHGELVTTVYVHFAVQGRALYVELQVVGLLPCHETFRVVDEVGGTGVAAVLRAAARAVLDTPATVGSAPGGLVRGIVDKLRIGTRRSAPIRVRHGYDYGARVSLRELGTSDGTGDPMRTQDIRKYGRIIERRVLAAILDFLESRGVDVAEYRQQSTNIINAGAVVSSGATVNVGGDLTATQNVSSQEGQS
jgi:hypothetical protein